MVAKKEDPQPIQRPETRDITTSFQTVRALGNGNLVQNTFGLNYNNKYTDGVNKVSVSVNGRSDASPNILKQRALLRAKRQLLNLQQANSE